MTLYFRIIGSFSGLSFAGSLLIIITFLLMKKLRVYPYSMVMFISVCDCIFSLKYIVTSIAKNSDSLPQNIWICSIQSITSNFFGLASVMWIGCMSIYLLISSLNPFKQTSILQIPFHIAVWTLSFLSTLIAILRKRLGVSDDGTCWFKNEGRFHWEFYSILILVFFLSAFATITSLLKVRSLGYAKAFFKKVFFRMIFYIAVFAFCWIGPLTSELYHYFNSVDERSSFWRWWVGISVSLVGLGNSIVWIFNPVVIKEMKKWLLVPCFKVAKVKEDDIPLLKKTTLILEDDEQDITKLSHNFRKGLLNFILEAIQFSIRRLNAERNTNLELNVNRSTCEFEDLEYTELCEDCFEIDDDCYNITKYKQSEKEIEDQINLTKNCVFLDYCPKVFHNIRIKSGYSTYEYYESLNPSKFLEKALNNQQFSSGKSGSFFCFSPDKRIIVKTISSQDAKTLYKILKQYYQHIIDNPDTLILRILGLFSIHVGMTAPIYVIVLNNVFWDVSRPIDTSYDLKGSYVDRGGNSKSTVNRDCDLKENILLSTPLRDRLLEQLSSDSLFLSELNLMDYSLLLGVHEKDNYCTESGKFDIPDGMSTLCQFESKDGKTLYSVGMIDFLQEYNLKKKLERFFKIVLLCKDSEGISVINPRKYQDRFMEKMNSIFVDS